MQKVIKSVVSTQSTFFSRTVRDTMMVMVLNFSAGDHHDEDDDENEGRCDDDGWLRSAV